MRFLQPRRAEEIEDRDQIQIQPHAGIEAQRQAGLKMKLLLGHFAEGTVVIEEEATVLDQRVARAA